MNKSAQKVKSVSTNVVAEDNTPSWSNSEEIG